MSRLNPPSRARILLPPFPRSNSNRVQQQNPPTKPSYLVESSRICQQMWNYCLLLLPCCCSLLFAIVLVNISTKAVNAVPPDAILFPTSSLAKNFTTALITTTGDSSSSSSQNSSAVVVAAVRAARTKRQYDQGGGGGGGGYGMCPAGCFPCSPMQCQSYQAHCMPQMPRVVNVMSCCCIPLVPAKPDLKSRAQFISRLEFCYFWVFYHTLWAFIMVYFLEHIYNKIK